VELRARTPARSHAIVTACWPFVLCEGAYCWAKSFSAGSFKPLSWSSRRHQSTFSIALESAFHVLIIVMWELVSD